MCKVRISTMAGPSMFLSKLSDLFAQVVTDAAGANDDLWPRLVAEDNKKDTRHIGDTAYW